ncbi:unnamed protein product [Didymodactylos carnosus]|uniref:Uncharacterized protein n=1 Tax=Didymodactylos carnosus TaxID=1234261 RepID=A0A814WLK1_9BILA|nr:unnamed protein product [Didymodactylos carnosus]CAF1200051.1 unnamed protein product [Didymodactylos carnosus]CAF3890900.1 unnamed protein product [Didymodactylos carnosus]CAF3964536.1 unnamed protein product [Didymodactylos carnosus]
MTHFQIFADDAAVIKHDPEEQQQLLTENNGALRVKRDDTNNNNNILSSTSSLNSLSPVAVVRSRFRNLKKSHHNIPSNFFKGSAKQHRLNKKLKNGGSFVDNRLKRFRMLDPEEFHEMLQSMSHLSPEQSKALNGVDTIGMQLEISKENELVIIGC